MELGEPQIVADLLAQSLLQGDLDEIDSGCESDEICHLTGWYPCCHFNDDGLVGGCQHLRERDPVRHAERPDRRDGRRADALELLRTER